MMAGEASWHIFVSYPWHDGLIAIDEVEEVHNA